MDSTLNTVLISSLVLLTASIVVFIVFLIKILNVIRRILLKIELKIDSFELTQEEIKLKILDFIDEILNKVKNYGRKTDAYIKKIRRLESEVTKGGASNNEKKD